MNKSEWGEYAYWVEVRQKLYGTENERRPTITVMSEKIKKVGRVYVTLDNPHENRFDMATRWEDKDYGNKRFFYPTLAEAEEAAHRKRLMYRMTKYLSWDGQREAEKLSIEDLGTLCFLLTGEREVDHEM